MGVVKQAKTLRYSDEYNHVFQLENALVDSQSSPLRPADFSYVEVALIVFERDEE
jgi:hypothetical protein